MARITARQGLLGKSFELAAEAVTDAVGCAISKESVRSVTQKWGKAVDEARNTVADQLFDHKSDERVQMPTIVNPIEKQATLSTDGGMVHVRHEGWKEVKLTVVSSVRPKTETELTPPTDSRRYAPYEPQLMIEDHSYQAGLWDANTAGRHQYAEALRRGVPECFKASAVADGARWIERITKENFPDMVQIVDWYHLTEKLWYIGQHYFPEKTPRTRWVNTQLDALWRGDTDFVIDVLAQLPLPTNDDALASALGYVMRQKERLAYPRYRVAGYPIGSGCVESGINTVVHHRLKTQGQGWKRANIDPMLAALSELHCGRFAASWNSIQ